MADKAWKQFERDSAALFGAKRKPANSGHKIDFEGPFVAGQCKLVKEMSLEALTKLVEEIDYEAGDKLGVVCIKRRRGRGRPSPGLVVMPFKTVRRMNWDMEVLFNVQQQLDKILVEHYAYGTNSANTCPPVAASRQVLPTPNLLDPHTYGHDPQTPNR